MCLSETSFRASSMMLRSVISDYRGYTLYRHHTQFSLLFASRWKYIQTKTMNSLCFIFGKYNNNVFLLSNLSTHCRRHNLKLKLFSLPFLEIMIHWVEYVRMSSKPATSISVYQLFAFYRKFTLNMVSDIPLLQRESPARKLV